MPRRRSGSSARRRIRCWPTTRSIGPRRRIWPSTRTQPLWLNSSRFARIIPDSVITEQVLQSIGVAAMALNQPAEAVSALDAYPMTAQRPGLLLLRGEAHEKAGQVARCGGRLSGHLHALCFERTGARSRDEDSISCAAARPGKSPPIPLDQRLAHADILFNAKEWSGARTEYAAILPQLSGAERERAELRILECGVALGASPSQMIALKITDPDVDAERSYTLADYYRSASAGDGDGGCGRERGFARAVEPVGCMPRFSSRGIITGCDSTATAPRATTSGSRTNFPHLRMRRMRSGAWHGRRC